MGNELRIDPAAVEALRLERLVERAAHDGNGERSQLAREPLAPWRGPPPSSFLAVRADFYGACARIRAGAPFGRNQVLVGPLRPDNRASD